MMQMRAESQGLELKFEYSQNLPHYLESDEGKLRQVLLNLLSNAIKFTAQGTVIDMQRAIANFQNCPKYIYLIICRSEWVKSSITNATPKSFKLLGSWVEATPIVLIPAAIAERIPEGESSKVIASSGKIFN
ncbi:Two-component hybrid sensor and regulator [Planktothrix agardhii]|nr:Two-component hybrid sensor and regulator [Planktothrix agardhii]